MIALFRNAQIELPPGFVQARKGFEIVRHLKFDSFIIIILLRVELAIQMYKCLNI